MVKPLFLHAVDIQVAAANRIRPTVVVVVLPYSLLISTSEEYAMKKRRDIQRTRTPKRYRALSTAQPTPYMYITVVLHLILIDPINSTRYVVCRFLI